MTIEALDTDQQIPVSRRVPCEFCGIVIDKNALGVFQYVRGWGKNRKSGLHAVQLIEREYRWACPACIDSLGHGRPIGQGSLF